MMALLAVQRVQVFHGTRSDSELTPHYQESSGTIVIIGGIVTIVAAGPAP
jgi:hypothetical protein